MHLPRPFLPPAGGPARLAATGGVTPSPPPPTRGARPGADSEQSVACHGMVFSMDFQETKKETKSKRINEGEDGGERNKIKQ